MRNNTIAEYIEQVTLNNLSEDTNTIYQKTAIELKSRCNLTARDKKIAIRYINYCKDQSGLIQAKATDSKICND